MSSNTTQVSTPAPPSAEELAYIKSQQALADKQLELLNDQQSLQKDYLAEIKPIMEKQSQLIDQQLAAQLSPESQALQKQVLELQAGQMELQKQQVEANKQFMTSYNSPEQKALQKQALAYQGQQMETGAVQLALAKSQMEQANNPAAKAIQDQALKLQMQQLQMEQQKMAAGAPAQKLQEQLLLKQLEQLERGYGPTPEQIAQIDAATNAALKRGTSDIDFYASDAVRRLGSELAPALGLRPTDTPIQDRGSLVTREAVRQRGNLVSELQAANAQARLGYPLQVGQLVAGSTQAMQALGNEATRTGQNLSAGALGYPQMAIGGAQGGLGLNLGTNANANLLASIGSASNSFQTNLADAANLNRLQLLGAGANATDLGFSGGNALLAASKPNPLSFARGLSQTATASPNWGQIAQGVGQAGMTAALIFASDRRLKDDIVEIGRDEKGLRWVSFKYKGDPEKRKYTGVIAQEAEKTDPESVLTNGRGVKFVDYGRLARNRSSLNLKRVA